MRPFSMTDEVDPLRSNLKMPHNQPQTDGSGRQSYHFDQATPAPSYFHTQGSHPTSAYPPSDFPLTTEHQSTSHLYLTSINGMAPHTMGVNVQDNTRDPQYHRGPVYYNPRTAPQNSNTSQPRMATHPLSNNSDGESYYYKPTARQPLANSMYAAVAMNAQIPANANMMSATSEMSQLENRVNKVERQQFQEGLNSQFSHISTARSLQTLQNEILQMKREIENNIPELRQTIVTLEAKLEVKENEERTRLIQIEPRTREEKLESAMKNASLNHIVSGVAMQCNLTSAEVSICGAAQMESLAKMLRSRVHKGGVAYILEAEDAEAWAAKLRENVSAVESPAETPVPQPQRSKNLLTVEMIKKHMIDGKMPEMLEKRNKPSETKPSAAEDANVINEVAKAVPHEHTQTAPAEEASDEEASDPWTMVAASPGSTSTCPSVKANSTVQRAESLASTIDFRREVEALIQVPDARASKPVPHRRYASEHTEVSKLSTSGSAAIIKVEEPCTSDLKSLQVITGSEVKSPINRGRKLAPHQRFDTQQAEASKVMIPKADIKAKSLVPETEVEGSEALARAIKIEATNEKTSRSIIKPLEIAEIAEVAEVKQDPAVLEAAEAQVPAVRTKKPAPHRRRATQEIEAPELPVVENNATTENEAVPSGSEKLESGATHEEKEQTSDQGTAEVAVTEKDLEPEEEESTEIAGESIQDAATQTNMQVTTDNSIWQPTYLKALPSLPLEELEVVPSSDKMHRFNRSFILSHLGGTRWLPSFYCVPEPERSLLPNRGFFILEDAHEPLGPSTPGSHGSLLAPIIRLPEANNPDTPKPEAMQNAPLFVKQADGYIFCGMYTYLRADRLDIERCDAVVPSSLKTFWAEQLTSLQRPKWVTEALQKHLSPPPTYSGPLPGHADEDQVSASFGLHMSNHEAWQRDTHFKTSFLRPEHILSAFGAPDTGAEMPGIRFWNLGLKCEGWDKGFYDMMVREEGIWEKEGRRDGEGERGRKEEMMRMLRARSKRPKKW